MAELAGYFLLICSELAVGVLGTLGRLPPNSLVGVRTKSTARSRQAWYAGQRSAGPWLLSGGLTAALMLFGFWQTMGADALSLQHVGGRMVLAVSAFFLLVSWYAGDSAAR